MELKSSNPPERMTCEQVIGFLMSYLDAELSEELRARFEAHIERCAACADYIDSYKKTVALGRQAYSSSESAVQEMPDELLEAILTAQRKSTSS